MEPNSRKNSVWGFRTIDLYAGILTQYLRLNDRTWRNVRFVDIDGQKKAIVVTGWILRFFRGLGSSPEYALVRDSAISAISSSAIDEILSKQNLPHKKVKVYMVDKHLYLDISHTWIPHRLFVNLITISSLSHVLHTEDGKGSYLQFREKHWSEAEVQIKNYGLFPEFVTLKSESVLLSEDEGFAIPSRLVSNIIKESYSEYFKKEEKIHYFSTDLALGEQEGHASEVSQLWNELNLVATNNHVATKAKTFLRELAPIMIDWKVLTDVGFPSTLHALVLSVDAQEFGQNYVGNYFKLFVPTFGSVLHLSTTVAPDKGNVSKTDPFASFQHLITLDKWRAFPFIGRLRNTGSANSLHVSNIENSVLENLYLHLAGLPTLEEYVARIGNFANFGIDHNTWTERHHPFTRTFSGTFEIRASIDRYSSAPAIYVKDIMGTPFRLLFDYEDYRRKAYFLSGLKKGDWIMAVVSSNPTAIVSGEHDPFEFYVQPYSKIRSVDLEEASTTSAAGLLREFRMLSEDSIELLQTEWKNGKTLTEALGLLREMSFAINSDGLIYYVPWGVKPQDVLLFNNLTEGIRIPSYTRFTHSEAFAALSLMARTLDKAHPFFYLKFTIANGIIQLVPGSHSATLEETLRRVSNIECMHHKALWNEAKVKYGYMTSQKSVMKLRNTTNPTNALNHALNELKYKGQIEIKAAGSAIPLAYNILDNIHLTLPYLFPRSDIYAEWLESNSSYKVRSVTMDVKTLEAKDYD